jgi:hypothetical protein
MNRNAAGADPSRLDREQRVPEEVAPAVHVDDGARRRIGRGKQRSEVRELEPAEHRRAHRQRHPQIEGGTDPRPRRRWHGLYGRRRVQGGASRHASPPSRNPAGDPGDQHSSETDCSLGRRRRGNSCWRCVRWRCGCARDGEMRVPRAAPTASPCRSRSGT